MLRDTEVTVRDWSHLPLILNRTHMRSLLGCCERTLTRKIHRGEICRPLNYGEGNNRWLRDDVRRWFEDGCPKEEQRQRPSRSRRKSPK